MCTRTDNSMCVCVRGIMLLHVCVCACGDVWNVCVKETESVILSVNILESRSRIHVLVCEGEFFFTWANGHKPAGASSTDIAVHIEVYSHQYVE